jgi:hypothetical protein
MIAWKLFYHVVPEGLGQVCWMTHAQAAARNHCARLVGMHVLDGIRREKPRGENKAAGEGLRQGLFSRGMECRSWIGEDQFFLYLLTGVIASRFLATRTCGVGR